jgi:thioredoxin reductase (NADPH)
MAEKVVIIGSGPAGHAAAIYAARAGLEPLMFEGFIQGGVAGGQLMTTTEVENYPGFPESVSGPDLMQKMRDQSERFGTRILTEDVESVDLSKRPFVVVSGDQTVETESLIIATGATAKRLHLPCEDRLWNRGISACAVCDGALPIFRDKVLAVVGGGDTAMEEATYLTHYAAKVVIIHRRDEFRASEAMQKKVLEHPKIEVIWDSVLEDAYGEKSVEGVVVRNVKTDETTKVPAGGLFYAIGHTPNTSIFKGQLEMDETGYLVTKNKSTYTSVEGVFAAGDVQDKVYRQAITAAGSGCMAALDCKRWLDDQD